jgi:circadian clock protein KaiC
MDGLVRTGVTGLDEILLGGLTRNNNVLVEGAPGTGKTTLGLAFIHAGATFYDEPGIIVSFELDPDKIVRDARGFDWRIDELVDAGRVKIINATPAVLLKEFRSEDSVLIEHIRRMRARRLMVDGLTPLKLYAEAEGLSFRQDLHTLIEHLTSLGVTTLMTSERELHSRDVAHERYVFDTIFALTRHETRRRVNRRITIEKSRGQDFIGGSHAMEIAGQRGIRVYRRAQARPKLTHEQPTSLTRMSTGIPQLDDMMGGGVYEGSITLVTGISGTGKTVAGVQFLVENARAGRRGLLVSLDEHPSQLARNAASIGFDLAQLVEQGLLVIHYESPLELDLDVHFNRISQLVTEHDISCIVFDSVAVYEMASPEEAADFLYSLATFCKDRLSTVYFNYESPELLGVSQISEELKGSHLVDNILLLNYVEISTLLRRALVAPKVRGSRNRQVTREYTIGQGGISVIDDGHQNGQEVPQLPFSAYYGLLSRSPSRQSPAIDEAIAKGKPLPDGTAVTATEQ